MTKKLLPLALLLLVLALVIWRIKTRELPTLAESTAPVSVGVFHVHSNASHDSSTTLDTLVRAARDEALDFVILTDHNTQQQNPVVNANPRVLSYAELSTRYGHAIQLGATTEPNAKERTDATDLILAHPRDRKRPWDGPVDHARGMEIANLSSQARELIYPLLAWPLRPELVIAQLYQPNVANLDLWDAHPDMLGFCAADAHDWVDVKPLLRGWHIVVAQNDTLLDALLQGRFYCAAGVIARAPRLVFEMRDDALVVEGPETHNTPATLVLYKNGRALISTQENTIHLPHPSAGVYRVEVQMRIPHLLFGSFCNRGRGSFLMA